MAVINNFESKEVKGLFETAISLVDWSNEIKNDKDLQRLVILYVIGCGWRDEKFFCQQMYNLDRDGQSRVRNFVKELDDNSNLTDKRDEIIDVFRDYITGEDNEADEADEMAAIPLAPPPLKRSIEIDFYLTSSDDEESGGDDMSADSHGRETEYKLCRKEHFYGGVSMYVPVESFESMSRDF